MIVAITGGSGFIGKHLINNHLLQGDTVRLLSRKTSQKLTIDESKVHLFNLDLLTATVDELSYFLKDADILYHCARELNDESRMHALHVLGTKKLLKAAKNNVKHWIQLSSVGVYGNIRHGEVTEESSYQPVGLYEISKMESDQLVYEAGKANEIKFTILRPSTVYMPDTSNQSIFQLINMVDRGLFSFIGKPGASANYIHTDNVVTALKLCSQRPEATNKIYNLSDHMLLEDFIATISHYLGENKRHRRLPEKIMRIIAFCFEKIPKFPLTTARINVLTNRTRYLNNRICDELGYTHEVTMLQGIQQMVKIYQRKKGGN